MSFSVQYRRYRLPFSAPVRTAHGPWLAREGVLVRVESADGATGYGEASPIPEFGTETVDQALDACAGLGGVWDPAVGGVPARAVTVAHALGAAVEEACGRAATPGGPARSIAALLPAGPAALKAAPVRAESGFRVFKWKVGVGDPADELCLLDELLGVLPSGASLRLDANGAWDRRVAERWLDRCSDRPIEFVEQPVARQARGSEDLLLGLAGDYPVALALDESAASEADIGHWLDAGWPGLFVVKPSLLAYPARVLARLEARGSGVVFSSALETVVGARAALRAAFAWRGPALALGFGVWPLFGDRRFDGPVAGPFLTAADVEALDAEAAWNALT